MRLYYRSKVVKKHSACSSKNPFVLMTIDEDKKVLLRVASNASSKIMFMDTERNDKCYEKT
jgi:hypothetical protein